jgi:hypothetical protein
MFSLVTLLKLNISYVIIVFITVTFTTTTITTITTLSMILKYNRVVFYRINRSFTNFVIGMTREVFG